MSDPYVDKVAGELADLALQDQRRSGDETIVDEISEIVGASSQTLQEAFLTAVRVRRAEDRARELLAKRASEQIGESQKLLSGETPEASAPAAPDQKAETPADTSALESLMDDLQSEAKDADAPAGVTPSRVSRK
ncbi:MAG: hypothetical protein ACSHW1_14990 [Yoonia sp.]|uniref:hypothetical protein n=1 Tax=Yoonia sp. TaxID=2212373 RepID=UPI003EF64D3B